MGSLQSSSALDTCGRNSNQQSPTTQGKARLPEADRAANHGKRVARMTLNAPPRPHAPARARSWTASLYRAVVGLLLLCICGWSVFVWQSSISHAQEGFATSLSGHSYHPKLCSSIASPGDTSSNACSELHDPHLAQEVVSLPAEVRLLSEDPQLSGLQQLLQATIKQQWPLPLARRVASVLLQGAVPHVDTASSSSSSNSAQAVDAKPAAPTVLLSATESGHTAGWRFVSEAVAVLKERSAGQLVPCSFDPSLPTDFHTRFLFAAAWPAATASRADSGSSTAAYANSVLQLLNAAALLPPGYVYISVSVPSDAAAGSLVWLDLLQLLAAPLGIPMQLVQGQAAATTPDAQPQQLPGTAASTALNAALTGFFPARSPAAVGTGAAAKTDSMRAAPQQESGQQHQGRRKLHTQRQLGGDSSTSQTDPSSSSSSGRGAIKHGNCPPGAPAPGCYAPEFIVLFEPQLYFCAGDLVRLMEYPEDLVCGLQLDEHEPVQLRHRAQHRRNQRRRLQATTAAATPHQQQQGMGATASAGISRIMGSVHERPMASAVAAAGQAVLKPEVPPEFEMHSLRAAYDATREVSGEMLSAHAPYFTSHGPSQELVQSGLPVPVYCCWGGVAKVNAGPLASGLRFRAGEKGECHPPDPMSLMCDDLWRTGHSRIILVSVCATCLSIDDSTDVTTCIHAACVGVILCSTASCAFLSAPIVGNAVQGYRVAV